MPMIQQRMHAPRMMRRVRWHNRRKLVLVPVPRRLRQRLSMNGRSVPEALMRTVWLVRTMTLRVRVSARGVIERVVGVVVAQAGTM